MVLPPDAAPGTLLRLSLLPFGKLGLIVLVASPLEAPPVPSLPVFPVPPVPELCSLLAAVTTGLTLVGVGVAAGSPAPAVDSEAAPTPAPPLPVPELCSLLPAVTTGLILVGVGEAPGSPAPLVDSEVPPTLAPPLLNEGPILVPLGCAELTLFSGTVPLITPPLLVTPLRGPSPLEDPPPLDTLAVEPDTPPLLLACAPLGVILPAFPPVAVITVPLEPETAGTLLEVTFVPPSRGLVPSALSELVVAVLKPLPVCGAPATVFVGEREFVCLGSPPATAPGTPETGVSSPTGLLSALPVPLEVTCLVPGTLSTLCTEGCSRNLALLTTTFLGAVPLSKPISAPLPDPPADILDNPLPLPLLRAPGPLIPFVDIPPVPVVDGVLMTVPFVLLPICALPAGDEPLPMMPPVLTAPTGLPSVTAVSAMPG
ncbi:hypothetical protein MTO96_032311 [Rhipicephalus appendiculatus]